MPTTNINYEDLIKEAVRRSAASQPSFPGTYGMIKPPPINNVSTTLNTNPQGITGNAFSTDQYKDITNAVGKIKTTMNQPATATTYGIVPPNAGEKQSWDTVNPRVMQGLSAPTVIPSDVTLPGYDTGQLNRGIGVTGELNVLAKIPSPINMPRELPPSPEDEARARASAAGYVLGGIKPTAPPVEPPTTTGTVLAPGTLRAEDEASHPNTVSSSTIPAGWGIVGQGYQSGANAWGDNPSGKMVSGVAPLTDPTMTIAKRTVGKDGIPLLEARGIANPNYNADLASKPDPNADINAAIDAIKRDPGSQLVGGKGLNSKSIAAITELEKAKGINANTAATHEQNRINQENLNIYRQEESTRKNLAAQDRIATKQQEDFQKELLSYSPVNPMNPQERDKTVGLFRMGMQGLPVHESVRPVMERLKRDFEDAWNNSIRLHPELKDNPQAKSFAQKQYEKSISSFSSLFGLSSTQ